MQHRALGRQGLMVSALGQGCMGLTSFYGADSAAADPTRLIHAAIERGVTYFDTADSYGPFVNEEAVGRALQGRRDSVVLASKFGVVRRHGQSDGLAADGVTGRPEHVKAACDASLARLRTDRIDLYLMHRPDFDTPIEETVGALADLVRAGKVRYIGLSEFGPALIRRAHATHPISAVQSEYSLFHRDPEDGVLATLNELDVGFICYSPLGRGFLTGKIRSIDDLAPDDWRRNSPRFQGENFARNLALLDYVAEVASALNVKPAQLALAWLLARGPSIAPLQGATAIDQLDENLGALDVAISNETMRRIDELTPRGAVAGDAWPAGSVGARVDRSARGL